MKSLACFDVDNTLLDHRDWKIPDSALRALERLRERYRIVVASGRDMDNQYSREYRDIIDPEAIIHMNGTKITVGGRSIHEHLFDKALLKRLLTFAEGSPYSVGISVDDQDFYTNPGNVARHDRRRWGVSRRTFRDPGKLLDQPVRTLVYIGPEEGALEIERRFPELKVLLFAGKEGADIVEQASSKGKGLLRLCEWYGVDVKDTVAFGDSMNDFEILQTAGIGVAMGNSIEELKAVADYVTTDVGDDGIWNACRHLKLI